jgi:hypothetical protein
MKENLILYPNHGIKELKVKTQFVHNVNAKNILLQKYGKNITRS